MILDIQSPKEFRPELLSRRGELTAWLLAIMVFATWMILRANEARFTTVALVLFLFLAFAAIGISLGNWMDRQSLLTFDLRGVSFQNGLRDVTLAWQEIRSIKVIPAQAGAMQIQVLGEAAHFEFRTMATLTLNGEVKGRSGFPNGEDIIDTLVEKAGLHPHQGESNYAYYARD